MEHGFRVAGDTAPKQSDMATQANTQANTRGLVVSGTAKWGKPLQAAAADPAPIDHLKRAKVSRRACMICREKKSKWYVVAGEGGAPRAQAQREGRKGTRETWVGWVGGWVGGREGSGTIGKTAGPLLPTARLPDYHANYFTPTHPTHSHTQRSPSLYLAQ